MLQKHTKLKDYFHIGFGIFACTTMIVQYVVIIHNALQKGLSVLDELMRISSYLTIWTNILVAFSFFSIAFLKHSKVKLFFEKANVQYAILAYILYVGIAFHILLSKIFHPTGANYYLNIILHYIIPSLYFIYWILFIENGEQDYKYSLYWLIYPMVYMLYFLGRGALTHLYPYPFADVNTLGYAIVFRNLFLLLLACYLLGLLLIFFDKRFTRKANPKKV